MPAINSRCRQWHKPSFLLLDSFRPVFRQVLKSCTFLFFMLSGLLKPHNHPSLIPFISENQPFPAYSLLSFRECSCHSRLCASRFSSASSSSTSAGVTIGAELTPEETERLAEHCRKKATQHKAWRERQKAGQPKTRTLKELAAAQKEGKALTPEESARLEVHRSRKKTAREKLVQQAETDPAAAAELAKKRAYQSEATKKSRQKMYEEAATGNPEAVERYENYLAARREAYHRKKQESERTA